MWSLSSRLHTWSIHATNRPASVAKHVSAIVAQFISAFVAQIVRDVVAEKARGIVGDMIILTLTAFVARIVSTSIANFVSDFVDLAFLCNIKCQHKLHSIHDVIFLGFTCHHGGLFCPKFSGLNM